MPPNEDGRLRELAAVSDSIRAITSTLELSEVLRLVLGSIKTLTEAEALSLMLHDPAHDELVFAAAETLQERTFAGLNGEGAGGLAGWVARTGRSARLDDPSEAKRLGIDPAELAHAARNIIAVPVHRAGRVIGALELADRYEGTDFTPRDEAVLATLADAFGASGDPAVLASNAPGLKTFFEQVASAVPSEDVALVLLDPDGHDRLLGASRRLEAGTIHGLRLRLDQGIAGWVARNRAPVRIDDVQADDRYYSGIEKLTGFTSRTMLAVPLVVKDRLLGVIQCVNKLDGSDFTEEELQMVQSLGDHAAIAIHHASLYREAQRAARTDDLTGLSNTRHFHELLPGMLERGTPTSLIVLDLDNFKAVVDAHGHLLGSRTLAQIGRVIAGALRPGDVGARYGGDEFVVILPETGSDLALARAEMIRAAIESIQLLEGTRVDVSGVTASVGVATFPQHGTNAEALFLAADAAMYQVKQQGKNAVGLTRILASAQGD